MDEPPRTRNTQAAQAAGTPSIHPMQPVDGAALLRLAATTKVHQVVGADELSEGVARGVADGATEMGPSDRAVLAA